VSPRSLPKALTLGGAVKALVHPALALHARVVAELLVSPSLVGLALALLVMRGLLRLLVGDGAIALPIPNMGNVKVARLTPAHLQGFYRSKLDEGLSPRTVQYLHVVLHRALKQARRWGLVHENAAEAVDPPKVPNKDVTPLSPDQARRFLEAVRGDRLEALYVLAVHTGMRQGELLALRWEDVDLEADVLRVRGTKTARSRRTVKLSQRASEAISRAS
jgi:integrase